MESGFAHCDNVHANYPIWISLRKYPDSNKKSTISVVCSTRTLVVQFILSSNFTYFVSFKVH